MAHSNASLSFLCARFRFPAIERKGRWCQTFDFFCFADVDHSSKLAHQACTMTSQTSSDTARMPRLMEWVEKGHTTFFVDADGTQLCGAFSNMHGRLRQTMDRESAKEALDTEMQRYTRVGINHDLMVQLGALKAMGCRLVLWTNRSECVREATRAQLGHHWDLFEEHLFREGNKRGDRLQGVVIDDDARFASCGLMGFVHVRWSCCHDLSCASSRE
ncbi:hypothetical protein ml_85 [Mollivirus sibericum]|uniref:hypothetical protein n=1 Tax=Mollivirus sibericum TaxID=1678078 RepID=UPI0006B2E167|nr:hypothetical protein ml_85 [Mollivirus sibericum]ALD61887.1 hypothetical protein ml_85 [Mollivirus sibericum]